MRARLAHLAAVAVVTGMVMLGVNSGQFARNYDLYGSPFGPDGEGDRQEIKYLNGYFSGPEVASNALRNTTLQVSTPVNGANQLIERTVVAVHRGLGIDPNDPQTTYGMTRYSVRQTSNGEDTAGNPLHFALLVGVAVVVVAQSPVPRLTALAVPALPGGGLPVVLAPAPLAAVEQPPHAAAVRPRICGRRERAR
jgi:hypothetical protein